MIVKGIWLREECGQSVDSKRLRRFEAAYGAEGSKAWRLIISKRDRDSAGHTILNLSVYLCVLLLGRHSALRRRLDAVLA